MSARLQAVATAIADQNGWTSYTDAQKAIDAADSVMFSEVGLDRAAEALFLTVNPQAEWKHFSSMSPVVEAYRKQARAVVAALREEA